MMTEQNIQALMQHLPEEYLEEAAAFRMAHPMPAAQAPSLKAKTPPRFLLRAALPIAAAACLAAVCGLFWWMGTRDDMRTVESRMHEIDEQRTSAAQTDSADSSETTASETSETTATTAAETETAPAQGSARVTGSAAGTAAQGTAKAQSTGAAQSTAKQTAKTTKPASNQTSAAETEPKLPYDPDIVAQYRLGDVNMDGFIDLIDSQLLLQEYNAVVVEGGESILTPEQRYLGDITNERVTTELDIWNDNAPLIETDYIISSADFILLFKYAADVMFNGIPMYPVEEYVKNDLPPYDEWYLYYPPGLIEMYGNVDADTDEESVYFPGFGWLPVRVEGERNWQLTDYTYYNASAYYGSDPSHCYLTVRYYCEDDGRTYKVKYSLYSDGGAADFLERGLENNESFTMLRPDDPTIILKYASSAFNGYLWNRLDLCWLYWAEGNWLAHGHGYDFDETDSEEDWMIFADSFYHICTLE